MFRGIISWFRWLFSRKPKPLTNGKRAARRPSQLGLEWLEDRAVPAASLDAAFIASSYQALLGRPVDPAGLSYWQGQLNQGESRAAVVTGITSSLEYRTRELNSLYQTYLGRNADGGGLAYWSAQLNAGASWEQVEAGISGSQEHYARVGQTPLGGLVDVFQNTVNRTIDGGGAQFFLASANAGASQTALATAVLNSGEGHADYVNSLYTTVLGRAPDAGASYWISQLNAGASRLSVMAGFLGSDEFAARLAATLPAASSDPNAAAATFLSAGHRFAAVQPPRIQLEPVQQSITAAPTVTAMVTSPGNGGAPTAVEFDVDINNDGSFVGPNTIDRVTAPVVNGVATATINFPEGENHLVRARAVDGDGEQGVSSVLILRRANVDTVTPQELDQIAQQNADNAAVANQIKETTTSATTEGPEPRSPAANPPNGSAAKLAARSETEPNDSPATANSLPVASDATATIDGTISTATDVDYYTFTLTTKSGVFIHVNSIEGGFSTTLDSTVTLFMGDGTTVIEANDNGFDFATGWPAQTQDADSTTADSSIYQDLAAGTYYVEVGSVGGTTGAYELSVLPSTNYSTTVPVLQSRPGAKATLYLDFNGYTGSGDVWNNGSSYTIPRFQLNGNTSNVFTPGEMLAIQDIYEFVAEDYSPFDINVTTSYSGSFTDGTAMRCVIGGNSNDLPNDNLGSGVLGISIENSFATGGTSDQVYFAFSGDSSYQSEASSAQIVWEATDVGITVSHEFGHTLGLYHYDDLPNNLPIMQWSGLTGRATWWKGFTRDESSFGGMPSFFQDDMAVISNSTNGFGYIPVSNTSLSTATTLTATGTTYGTSDVIISPINGDRYYKFATGSTGMVTINADVNLFVNDLHAAVKLLDSFGTVLANDDNANSFDAGFTQTLAAGTYYVDVYSNGVAGEAGQFQLTITVPSVPTGGGGGTGGGGTGGVTKPFQTIVSTSDIYAPNQTSDKAHDFGSLDTVTIFSYQNLNITSATSGQFEWYKWEASAGGTFYATLTTTSGGPLEMHLFTLPNGILTELSSTTSGTLSTGLTQGQAVYIEVKGDNTSFGVKSAGSYNLDVALEPN